MEVYVFVVLVVLYYGYYENICIYELEIGLCIIIDLGCVIEIWMLVLWIFIKWVIVCYG